MCKEWPKPIQLDSFELTFAIDFTPMQTQKSDLTEKQRSCVFVSSYLHVLCYLLRIGFL
jgi:hypothetical protein